MSRLLNDGDVMGKHTFSHTRLMWIHLAPLKRAPTAQVGQTGVYVSIYLVTKTWVRQPLRPAGEFTLLALTRSARWIFGISPLWLRDARRASLFRPSGTRKTARRAQIHGFCGATGETRARRAQITPIEWDFAVRRGKSN